MNDARHGEIMAHERTLVEAMKTSNVALLDSLLHDDLLFNGPTGDTATKAMDLANYRSGGIRLRTVESSDARISFIGDDAVVAITVRIEGDYMGQHIDGRVRYLRVWKSIDGGWKVIGGSVIPLP